MAWSCTLENRRSWKIGEAQKLRAQPMCSQGWATALKEFHGISELQPYGISDLRGIFPVETEKGGPLAIPQTDISHTGSDSGSLRPICSVTCGLREYDVGGHDCYLSASVPILQDPLLPSVSIHKINICDVKESLLFASLLRLPRDCLALA